MRQKSESRISLPLIKASLPPHTSRHPEVLAATRRASKDGRGRQRVGPSFETPRTGAAPQDDGGVDSASTRRPAYAGTHNHRPL